MSGWRRALWRLRCWSYILRAHRYDFNSQDLFVVPLMTESHPEPFFRPDVSIAAWRRMVEDEARRPPPSGEARAAVAE